MADITLRKVVKRYEKNQTIHGVDLQIDRGGNKELVGPSGGGKSTLLRMVAGLEEISEGELYIDGRKVNDVDPADRGVAMVFQSYALYPHNCWIANRKTCPVASVSVWRLVGRLSAIRKSSCLMNRYRIWMPSYVWKCAYRLPNCIMSWVTP